MTTEQRQTIEGIDFPPFQRIAYGWHNIECPVCGCTIYLQRGGYTWCRNCETILEGE